MNKIFRVIWNDVLSLWQCVSELSSAKKKRASHNASPRVAHQAEMPYGVQFTSKPLLCAILMATLSLSGNLAHATVNETINTPTTKNGTGGYFRIGHPQYESEGNVIITVNQGGSITLDRSNLQITGHYAQYSYGNSRYQQIKGSALILNGGKLDMTNSGGYWLDIGRSEYGYLVASNGATINHQGNVGIGAWRPRDTSQLSSLTLSGASTKATIGKDIVVGDSGNSQNGAGKLFVQDGATLKVGTIKTDNSNTHAELYFSNANVELTRAGTLFANIDTSDAHGDALGADVIQVTTGTLNLTTVVGNTVQASTAVITGDGGIAKKGEGTFILTANNTFTGGVTVEQGTVQAGNGGESGTFGTGTVTVKAGATASVNRSDTMTLSNTLAGEEGSHFKVVGSGTVIIDHANDGFLGDTTIENGTLQLGDSANGNSGSIGANPIHVSAAGTLAINNNGDTALQNLVDGSGILHKKDGYTLTFTQSVTVSKTLIDDGTLKASASFSGGDVVVGDKNGAEKSAIFETEANQNVTVNSILINRDGLLRTKDATSPQNASVFTVNKDLTVDGGNIDFGANTTVKVSEKANIKAGDVTLGAHSKFEAGTLNVGDGEGDAGSAKFTANGGYSVSVLNVAKDGEFTNNVDASADTVNVDGGTLNTTKKLTASNALNLNSGTINMSAEGRLTGKNLYVGDDKGGPNTAVINNDATDVSTNNAISFQHGYVRTDGKLLNRSATGSMLFENLNVDGGTVEAQAGKILSRNTQLNDGKILVDPAGTYYAENTLNVGDGNGGPKSAQLINKGTLTLTNGMHLQNDGYFENNTTVDTNLGNVTLDGGEVKLAQGKTTSTTTTINDGKVGVEEGAEYDPTTLIVGNGDSTAATFTNAGTTTTDTLTVNSDGNVSTSGTLKATTKIELNGGNVEIIGGETKSPTTKINAGVVSISDGAKLNSDNVLVGDGTGEPNTAKLTNEGQLQAKTVSVKKDGNFTNSKTAQIDQSLTLEGGKVTLENGSVTTVTQTTDIKDGAITNKQGAQLNSTDVKVGDGTGEDNTATFTNEGALTADTMSVKKDGNFTNSKTAQINQSLTLEGGEVTLENGSVTTVTQTTDIKDGTITNKQGAQLNSTDVKVGDGTGEDNTATFTNEGALTADTMSVKKDGNFTNSKTAQINQSLTLEGGEVTLKNGSETTVKQTTDIQDGTLTNEAGAKLKSKDIKVGDGTGDAGSASFVNTGETESETITVKKDGALTSAGKLDASSSLTLEGGKVDITAGTTTTPLTAINEGSFNIGAEGKLASDAVTVGDGDSDRADLTVTGDLEGKTLTVQSDGHVSVENGGSVKSSEKAELQGGELAVKNGGSLAVGGDDGAKDLIVNTGKLAIDGEVSAKNLTSDLAQAGDVDDAKIIIGESGHLSLSPASGDNLFSGFDTSKGDQLAIDGTLTVNVADGVSATQASTAGITGEGTFSKTGTGTLTLTAENTFKSAQSDDGTLIIADGSKLNVKSLQVGNSDNINSTVKVEGEVNTETVDIKPDGSLIIGNDLGSPTGTLKATGNVAMDGGNFEVKQGSEATVRNVTSPDTEDAQASTVKVGSGGKFTLNPLDGDKLFDGFKTVNNGKDTIDLGGDVEINVPDAATVTLAPDQALSGSGSLKKTGPGLLRMQAQNPFSGSVTFENGRTEIEQGGNFSNAPVTVKGPNTTLAVDKDGSSFKNFKLENGGTLSVSITSEGYTKIPVTESADLSGGKLFIDVTGAREEDLEGNSFAGVLTTQNGQITNTSNFSDNSELFTFRPSLNEARNSLTLIPYAAGSGQSLKELVKKKDLPNALPAATVLDELFDENPGSPLSIYFYSPSSGEEALNALLQALPTLSGAGSQILSDSAQRLSSLGDLDTPCASMHDASGHRLWAKSYGAWSSQDTYGGSAGYHGDAFGLAAGSDVCVNQSRVGFVFGYGYDDVKTHHAGGTQTLRADTVQTGVYASVPLGEILDVDLKAGLGYSHVSTRRDLPFAQVEARGKYGNVITYTGAGLNLLAFGNEHLQVRPFVRMDYIRVHNNSYNESGAKALNLHVDSGNYDALVTQVGVKLKLHVANLVSAGASASVGYNMLSEKSSTTAQFEGYEGHKFTTEGAQHGRVSGHVGFNVNYQFTPASELTAGYDFLFRNGFVEHMPSVSYRFSF